MAKNVGELQALSRHVAFRGSDLSLSYLPEFVAKTESVRNPLPRSFLVKSLEDFVGDIPEERSLCLVRAMRVYLERTSSLSPRRVLFLSLQVIPHAFCPRMLCRFSCGAVADSSTPRAHSVQGVATSLTFL